MNEEIILKPAWIPIRCPNCQGYGQVGKVRITCNVCKGEGYLKVPPRDEEVAYDNQR